LRFPAGRIVAEGPLRRGHAAALIELPRQDYSRDLYVICAHFQSKAGPAERLLRQRQSDAIVAWIRDAKSADGEITLPQGTPFVVLGDLNVIDHPSSSLNTLLTGHIADEQAFGPDIRPDWDGSNLTAALPHHNESGSETYTWRDDTQPFPPGALDRIVYSDSVITVARSFVLNTMRMTDGALHRAGLHATDVMRDPANGIYDHLPVVADLTIPHATVCSARAPLKNVRTTRRECKLPALHSTVFLTR
jgi:endonuclease/exonuclease/phosphatase family metal-dependent hydrolase